MNIKRKILSVTLATSTIFIGTAIAGEKHEKQADKVTPHYTKEEAKQKLNAADNKAEHAWDETKEASKEAWNKTKEASKETWDETKEVSKEAWSKTKKKAKKAWHKSKDAMQDE